MAGAIRYDPIIDADLALGVGPMTVTNPGGGQMTGGRINIQTFALFAQATFNPGAVPGSGVVNTQVSCPGARIGYPCMLSFTGILGHLDNSLTASVTVDDFVLVTLLNNSTEPLTTGSGTVRVFCFPIPLL